MLGRLLKRSGCSALIMLLLKSRLFNFGLSWNRNRGRHWIKFPESMTSSKLISPLKAFSSTTFIPLLATCKYFRLVHCSAKLPGRWLKLLKLRWSKIHLSQLMKALDVTVATEAWIAVNVWRFVKWPNKSVGMKFRTKFWLK